MGIRGRQLAWVAGWTLLVVLLMVAVPLLLRSRLPEPLAVEWSMVGVPESSSSLRDFVFGKVVWWLVVVGVWVGLVWRGVLRGRGLALAGAVLALFGWVLLGSVVLSTIANLDAAEFREASELTGTGWLALTAAPVAWLGWRLGARAAD